MCIISTESDAALVKFIRYNFRVSDLDKSSILNKKELLRIFGAFFVSMYTKCCVVYYVLS
jgi:hypothetical protein